MEEDVHLVVDAAAPIDVVEVRAIEHTLLTQYVHEQSSGVETQTTLVSKPLLRYHVDLGCK